MSAEVLREAAALIRERAAGLTWDDGWYTPREMEATIARGEGFASPLQAADATHIASWHPAVALAVADWLEDEADRIPPGATHALTSGGLEISIAAAPAVRVARAYLGADR